jgi:high affinity Mn2+ porin
VASDVAGSAWQRRADKIGAALVVNGLSNVHMRYLQMGGQGSGLGDGALNFGAERIVEFYYNAQIWRQLSVGVDYQFVTHPGYNRDRGPVSVFGIRLHLEDVLPIDRF